MLSVAQRLACLRLTALAIGIASLELERFDRAAQISTFLTDTEKNINVALSESQVAFAAGQSCQIEPGAGKVTARMAAPLKSRARLSRLKGLLSRLEAFLKALVSLLKLTVV